jgi:hypothetical protein
MRNTVRTTTTLLATAALIAAALTLEFVNAKPREGDGVNSHKLVVFLRAIGETEKNLRR